GLLDPLTPGLVSPQLETLHQRAVARAQAADPDHPSPTSWAYPISPERAAVTAQATARPRGEVNTQLTSIELQNRASATVHAVRMGPTTMLIDPETVAAG